MDINQILAAYNDATAREKAAKKEREKLAAMVKDFAGGREHFTTDAYIVIIDKRKRTGLDADALRKDFPDIADVYGKTTEYDVITVKAAEPATAKTA